MPKKKRGKAKAAEAARGIVGPDYMQLLKGRLLDKDVAIILCGESHEDAIDVTRQGGKFVAKEGWVQSSIGDLAVEMWSRSHSTKVRHGALKRKDKSLPLGKARDWATECVEYDIDLVDHGSEIVFLWIPLADTGGNKGNLGRAYVIELFLLDDGEPEKFQEPIQRSTPEDVTDVMLRMTKACESFALESKPLADAVKDLTLTSTGSGSLLFQWADLDSEARMLNHRRLLGDDIEIGDYDSLIEKRKIVRRNEENIFTWDDWFSEMRLKCSKAGMDGDTALHLVLEASIPPWEVELCREEDGSKIKLFPAADCIRCMSEDSEASEMDEYDPSSDGLGFYIDFVYRKFMEDQANCSTIEKKSHWLHCVDSRDLGCEHACVADSLHEEWMGLLRPEERKALSGNHALDTSSSCGTAGLHTHWRDGRCLLDWETNPEDVEVKVLQEKGLLEKNRVDEEAYEEAKLITFPSFEGFMGQNTDILYYAPNVKVAYAPFIGQCAGSFHSWEKFFTNLFFGGTVPDALSNLDLSEHKRQYLHVRSPILKVWDPKSGEYEWHRRNDDEHDVTFPILPVNCYLKARGSDPPRTWSSQIFAELSQDGRKDCREIAHIARSWALGAIEKHAQDPKGSDDEHGGGEWFLAFLRATQRETYDDIDRTDPAALLSKKYMPGESCGKQKKHKIGDILIPSCEEGFQGILQDLSSFEERSDSHAPARMSPLSEVMAKITVDIYMSRLIDFSAVLKVAQLVANEPRDKVVIVCYMGSVHCRSIGEFYCEEMGFKKRVFAGNNEWDDDVARVLHLPQELWNLNTALF